MKTIKVPGLSKPVALDAPICLESPHFTWAEATKGGARIPESATITRNIIKIATALEDVREIFGGKTITITSWYRPLNINRSVGGSTDSQHINGLAVDLKVAGISPRKVTATLSKTWVGGVGDSPIFTHLDLGENRRWNY